jgi:hypothetical protein
MIFRLLKQVDEFRFVACTIHDYVTSQLTPIRGFWAIFVHGEGLFGNPLCDHTNV